MLSLHDYADVQSFCFPRLSFSMTDNLYLSSVPSQVPIQKIKPVRPAPAARHTPALEVFAPKAPPRKRARVAAGGTALLALFCFAVFSGPMLPLGGVFNFNGAAPVGQVCAPKAKRGQRLPVPCQRVR